MANCVISKEKEMNYANLSPQMHDMYFHLIFLPAKIFATKFVASHYPTNQQQNTIINYIQNF